MSTLGAELKRLRVAKGLTQEQLGLLMGHEDGSTVSKYEKGRITPSKAVLAKFAHHLGVKVATLTAIQSPYDPHGPRKGLDVIRRAQAHPLDADSKASAVPAVTGVPMERYVLRLFRQLPEERQHAVANMLAVEVASVSSGKTEAGR